jgi:hypothetical protein
MTVVRRHGRAYVSINLVYYGAVAVSMAYVTTHPELQRALTEAVVLSFSQGPMETVAGAYREGHVLEAALLTFSFNFFAGSVLVLLLPSTLVPFSGLLLGFVRAVLWGLLLAPTSPELQAAMVPHFLTLLIEGQGYILTLLAVWVFGRAFVAPSSVEASSWQEGYVRGLRKAGAVMVLAALVLAIAAVYEALEIIYLVPLLLN